MKYGITFVCQEGLLEVQSAILAASLRANVSGDFVLTAAIPNFGKVSSSILDLFKQIDVNVVDIKNNFRPLYLEGNKILASAVPQKVDRKLFLDSDNICIKPLEISIFDKYDFYCTCTDPYIALSKDEWENIYSFYDLELPLFNGLNRIHTQAVVVMFSDENNFSRRWLENAKKLNSAINNGFVSLLKKRQIDQLSLGASLRSHKFSNPIIDDPMTWNDDPNWWSYDRCKCHPWERSEFIGNRKNNKIVSTPDMVFGYMDGEPFSLDLPYFLVLQNGANFCETHQGKSKDYFRYWIDRYSVLKDVIYQLIDKHVLIKSSNYWDLFNNRYLLNSDNKWFAPNRNDGNFIFQGSKIWL